MMITAVQLKWASMITIGVGSFVIGVLPRCFLRHTRNLQRRLWLSCLLCIGAGVLLGTSVLHMLPEVRENLPEYAELVFTCGFLLLYFIDEFVHCFWGKEDRAREEQEPWIYGEATRGLGDRCRCHSHQVFSTSCSQSGNVCIREGSLKLPYQSNVPGNGQPGWRNANYGAAQCTSFAPPPAVSEDSSILQHDDHTDPCANAQTGIVGLLLALTVHAVLEGLAIGLQKEIPEVLLLVGAVASHKFVVAFCLGLELAGAGSSKLKLVSAIFVFSSGSALGIGIGMLTFHRDGAWTKLALPILQGLAGGTLLYVTVSEVLPRERSKWHRSKRRSAGLLQFLSVALGFVLIFLLNNYVRA